MEAATARHFWVRAPGVGEILTSPLPPGQEDDVLVKALFSGISRGTEALVFRGEVPPSQHSRMRAPFQEGDFPAPVKYGYANVGLVLEGPARLEGCEVFCLFPHQDLYRVPASAVTRLPERLPAARAVLAANMETALNGVWDGAPLPGDRIVVIGGGVVGILTAWLCGGIPGCDVTLVDLDPRRAPTAESLGLDFATAAPDACEADLVFHASGSPEGLVSALLAAGPEATIVELSWYGTRAVELPLGEAFHSKRLTLRSSQVGRLPPGRLPRWDHARRMALALDLLDDDRLDVLVSGESPFEDLPAVMQRLSSDSGAALCHRIRYPAA